MTPLSRELSLAELRVVNAQLFGPSTLFREAAAPVGDVAQDGDHQDGTDELTESARMLGVRLHDRRPSR